MSRNRNAMVDEREERIATESLAWAAFAGYIYTGIVILYKIITTKSLSSTYLEVGLVLTMTLFLFLNNMKNKTYYIPSNIKNKKIVTGSSKSDKKARILYYMKGSILFPLVWATIYFFLIEKSGFIIMFLGTYVIDFICSFLWNEWNIKKYNSNLKSLEEDEDIN